MSEPTTSTPSAVTTRSDVSQQIGNSMSAIWQRRDGARPTAVTTEYTGDVVRCVIAPGEAAAVEEGADAEPATEPTEGRTGSTGYRHEVEALVSRLTKRTVKGFVSKSDKETGEARNSFILEPLRVKR